MPVPKQAFQADAFQADAFQVWTPPAVADVRDEFSAIERQRAAASSSLCRDWLRTLWPASYKGFAFFFETDDEEGGRGLVIHKFPNRDDPYLEDLGEEPRFYEGSAYVTGETADRLAVALTEMLASRGPGSLVVPIRGPVVVRCQTFQRRHDKDRMGYVAFRVKFVREGAATGLISIPHLSSMVLGSSARLVAALADAFPRAIITARQPDFVTEAAVEAAKGAALTIDAFRLSEPVDPTASARLRDQIDTLYDAIPDLLSRTGETASATLDAVYAAIERYADRPASGIAVEAPYAGAFALALALSHITTALADALPAEAAVRAMRDLALAYPAEERSPLRRSKSVTNADENRMAVERHIRLSALAGFAEAITRRTYKARPEGVTARAEVAARFEAELENSGGAANAELFIAIQALRGNVVEFLTRLIADLAPIVTVQAPRAMPALWWAWRLYADPTRDAELIERNFVQHPAIMPATFQALAR